MGRESFRLRKNVSDKGSYLQWQASLDPGRDSTLVDSALRADGIIFASPILAGGGTSFFEAVAISPTDVLLNWSLSEAVQAPAGGTTVITEMIIRHSLWGEPQTVNDGELVLSFTYNSAQQYNQYIHNNTQLQYNNRWAYYSLFVKFDQDNGTETWFERLAYTSELVPNDNDYMDSIWKRIPQHYRLNDVNSNADGLDGDLYRFIELFAWEFNKTRALLDNVMMGYDPNTTHSQAVDFLAKQLGLEVTSQGIGPEKVRALMQDIGYLRRRKGTEQATIEYLASLTGCNVDIQDLGVGAPKRWRIKIYSQRANFINDSTFKTTRTSGRWDYYKQNVGASIGVVQVSGGGLNITNYEATAQKISIYGTAGASVPYQSTTEYFASVQLNNASVTFEVGLPESVPTAEVPAAVPAVAMKPLSGRSVLRITTGVDASQILVYPSLLLTIPAGQSVYVTNWMLEPYSYGEYFDGDSPRGGFLQALNAAGTYDYRWGGNQYQSFSYYTSDYGKLSAAVVKVMEYIFPINQLTNYEVRFNALPGD